MKKDAHLQVGTPVEDIRGLLARLFWKQPEMVGVALDFLNYVKEWGRSETPFRASQWRNYCERRDITQSQYHNMLKRLRRAGMIRKGYNNVKKTHELFLSDNFSSNLESMRNVWDDYLAR